MKPWPLLACGLALGIAGLVWRATHSQPAEASAPQPRARMEPGPEKAAPPTPQRPTRLPAGHGEAVMDAIQTATATHDVRMVPLLARYLESDAAEVRAAALQGLIQLGERDAIPYLKIAVQETTIPEEKIELVKAIEFLSLPTWKEHRNAIKATPPSQP